MYHLALITERPSFHKERVAAATPRALAMDVRLSGDVALRQGGN
jgi:hypothetical protein